MENRKRSFVQNIFNEFLKCEHINQTNTELQRIIRDELKKTKGVFVKMPTKSDILNLYLELIKDNIIPYNPLFENLITTKVVRSSSGVLPISIALSAIPPSSDVEDLEGNSFSCAYNCSFCPNECVANGAPKDIARSYLSNEGTFTRGALSDFDTIRQVWRRLAELENMGHLADKLEIIPLGGTWGCYSKSYRYKFSHDLFYACNSYKLLSIRLKGELSYLLEKWLLDKPFLNNLGIPLELLVKVKEILPVQSLQDEKNINTKSNYCRIIGIVFETRPDKINKATLNEKRILGCTRIQLGIQHTDNDILQLNNRGHTVETSIRAIKYCRDAGFKVDIHIMPDLPFTTIQKDYEMINKIFLEDDLQPDYCKLYPCLDLPYTQARIWKEKGIWKPIAENDFNAFLDFLCYTLSIIPPWVRVNRVQRDFLEATEKNGYLGFVSDTIKTNLHQIVEQEMKKRGLKCYDIRSREIKNINLTDNLIDKARLYIRVYKANDGLELFLSVEIPKGLSFDDTYLLGLCRLRLPNYELYNQDKIPNHYLSTFKSSKNNKKIARIRELHVYGNISSKNSQHKGVGKLLIHLAENISKSFGFSKCCIISGVGVRDYYKRFGYYLEDETDNEYMLKEIQKNNTLELFGKTFDYSNIFYRLKKENSDHSYKKIQNGFAKGYVFCGYKKNNINQRTIFVLFFTLIICLLVYILFI